MAKIYFDIITLFPQFFSGPLQTSLLAKSQEKGITKINLHDLRNFGIGKHKQVDDRPFGGGPGMVLRVDVLKKALDTTKKASIQVEEETKPYVILLDPSGGKFDQGKAVRLSRKRRILFICGHYEGVDERFKQYVDEEISIGDYILNGGEVAALVLIESVARLIPGFLGKAASTESESFAPSIQNGKNVRLLDYPSYTRPENYEGEEVPKILLSGNHKEIEQWRKSKAIEKTKKVRPDLINIYTSK